MAGRLPRSGGSRLRGFLVAGCLTLGFSALLPGVASAVTVSPLPGTPDASPDTQISILGTAASNIASVSVTGSVSGLHAGHLEAYSAAQGASFLLNESLTEGEEVQVVVDLNEGAPIDDSFTVAHMSGPPPLLEGNGGNAEDEQHFVTRPELTPAKIEVTKLTPGLEGGDWFLDPLPAPIIHVGKNKLEVIPVAPNGPMILNPEGKLLWFDQLPKGEAASNTELTSYEGKPAVAWWQGVVAEAAYGLGEGIIANTSYEPIATVKAGNGYHMDIHEFNIEPSGVAYIDAYASLCLPECSASSPPVVDAVVQEIDIKTGLVMWEWHAMGHVPMSDTEVPEPLNGVYDPYHVNAIQPLPENHVLISLRDTSSVYYVNQSNGEIVWQIGANHSSFKLGKGATFYFQHDARLEGNELTLFDNESGPPIHGDSRGLVLHLNMSTKKAHVRYEYVRAVGTGVAAEGGVQHLSGGDVVVSWGATQYFSQFTKKGGTSKKRGAPVFEAQLPAGDGDYRVFRDPWTGTPKTLPTAAVQSEAPGEDAVYASWNGATEVARWEVLAGESADSLAPVGSAEWSNFETKIPVASSATVFEVRALNSEGKVLGTSEPVSAL